MFILLFHWRLHFVIYLRFVALDFFIASMISYLQSILYVKLKLALVITLI